MTGRLKRKISNKGSKKVKVFEVFKKNLDRDNFSTCVSEWDEQSLKFQNEYHLSFFLVLRAFNQIVSNANGRRKEQAELFYGIGNYCRKTLEAFTEFYEPKDSEFGVRLNNICHDRGWTTPVDLGRLANDASHSSLDRGSAIVSYATLEQTVKQTLAFIKTVDEKHFNKMLEHLLGKEEAKALENDIAALVF